MRWNRESPQGHYESWFVRANHPQRRLAFWIRYTLFVPAHRPHDAEGELWAVFFDGESRRVTSAFEAVPVAACEFPVQGLGIRIREAFLEPDRLQGQVTRHGQQLAWDLRYSSPAPPLLLLDRPLYDAPLPKAKSLVSSPFAGFEGALIVNGERWPVDGWIGSQNHNWGQLHTHRYAWGQVMGFDEDPQACLELATAQVKLGPVQTPPLTVMVLRLDGRQYALNTLVRALRSVGAYDYFQWWFYAENTEVQIRGTLTAAAGDFTALPYRDPPGGIKTCLNTKLACCHLTVRRPNRDLRTLSSSARAAFEILTTDDSHGIKPQKS